jgi:peroxiredoxin
MQSPTGFGSLFPSPKKTNPVPIPSLSVAQAPYWFEKNTGIQSGREPLLPGDQAPGFSLPAPYGLWTEEAAAIAHAGRVTLNDLVTSRPVVVSFYSPHTNAYGHAQLEMLVRLYPKIRALGGELLVFTPEPVHQLPRIASYYQVPFSLVHDADHRIAAAFGLYSPVKPVWQRISGIGEAVALPGTFVISPQRQVAYAFTDTDFNGTLPVRPLLTALYNVREQRIKKAA